VGGKEKTAFYNFFFVEVSGYYPQIKDQVELFFMCSRSDYLCLFSKPENLISAENFSKNPA